MFLSPVAVTFARQPVPKGGMVISHDRKRRLQKQCGLR